MRSFKPRRRRLGAAAQVAYDTADHFRQPALGPVFDPAATFGRRAPLVLDIGFGTGEALVELAHAEPERDVVGVDVHQPGIARVLVELGRLELTNVRVVEGDALEFMDRLAPAALAEIRIWFPDPWPKLRQQKRRLVRPDILTDLVDRLAPGGVLRLATDWPDYADQMVQVAGAEPRLAGGVVARPSRPETRFEAKGRAEGREPVDLVFTRLRDSSGS